MYRSMTGLGVMSTSATGISSSGFPTCITAEEKAEAHSKCAVSVLRGIGATTRTQTGQMLGRLAGLNPCDLMDLPVCPTPQCLDQYTASLITDCIAGRQSNPDLDCTSLYTYALSQLPFCGGGSWLPPIPSCWDPQAAALRDYCKAYPGINGPDKQANAACYAATHDPQYRSWVMNTPACADQPRGPQMLDPVHRTPAAPPSDGGGGAGPDAGGGGGGGTTTSEASSMGMLGILALLAVGGGGYYMYRKYKH